MKALMSYTSSVLEWLGRYVGLLVFGLLFVTALIVRTTMMTGYFEWQRLVAFLGMFMFQVGPFCF